MCVCVHNYTYIFIFTWYGMVQICPESWNHDHMAPGSPLVLANAPAECSRVGNPIPQFGTEVEEKHRLDSLNMNHRRTISFGMAGQFLAKILENTMSLQYWTIEWSLMHISSRIALISCQGHLSPEFCLETWNTPFWMIKPYYTYIYIYT